MSRRVLCKFFAQGACLKGDSCEFSHDWKDPPNNICTFYQKGLCSYGNRCRYDHVKVTRPQHGHPLSSPLAASSSSNSRPHAAWSSSQASRSPGASFGEDYNQTFNTHMNSSSSNQLSTSLAQSEWRQAYQPNELLDENDAGSNYVRPADLPICSFAAAGNCPHGENCPHLHGDLCSICGKHCLHPHRSDEREDHIKMCQKNNKHLEALKYSQEIECCICLDRVLSKPTPVERKFGLLSECDHPFCISCIRNWRSNSPASGMDVNTALRACPICRKLSYFVIPSVIWYATKEEKQEIVDGYKSKLKSIDCKYFDFGNATCPFGSSCFYKHTCLPGRNRPNNRRDSYRPRTDRPSQVIIEDDLENIVDELFVGAELDDFNEYLDTQEQLSDDYVDEDLDSLLAIRFMLMELGSLYDNLSSDDEI